jgi:hypothetical protein
MARHCKAGVAPLLLITLVIIYPVLLVGLEGCKPNNKEAVSLSFEVNEFYWETQEVDNFDITDLANTGRQEIDILIVDLTVTNESNRKTPLMFWYVTNAEGLGFEPTVFGDIPFEEDISTELIHPGEIIRGKVAFEVPSGHLPLWIHCAQYTAEAKIE